MSQLYHNNTEEKETKRYHGKEVFWMAWDVKYKI